MLAGRGDIVLGRQIYGRGFYALRTLARTRALMGALVNLWAWPAVKDKDKLDYDYFIVSIQSCSLSVMCVTPRVLHVASLHPWFYGLSHLAYILTIQITLFIACDLGSFSLFAFSWHVAKGSPFHRELMVYLYDVLKSIVWSYCSFNLYSPAIVFTLRVPQIEAPIMFSSFMNLFFFDC